MDRWELILGLGLAFVLVFAVIFIVLYVLKSIGLFGMAKKAGIENSWLAWIPVADMYIMGKLVGKIKLFIRKSTNWKLFFLWYVQQV
ncbi:MAG: hypothetical protein PWP07_1060 [Epulopiscium sp.]|jgi:hypothetical protein|nr:conserved rane protein of unknown function [Defluviitaleaceae bacterium]MDK2787835.1 hypothetical protein [Candidatus Epulonipiscium sp.]